MCYSAKVKAEFAKFVRHMGAVMNMEDFEREYFPDERVERIKRKRKRPRGMDRWAAQVHPELAGQIAQDVAEEIAQLEQDVFTQRQRVVKAERALTTKVTKKAQEDVRIGSAKVKDALRRLDDLKRTEVQDKDWRFFPNWDAPVLVVENGQRVIKPMRYRCRLPGWSPAVENKYPGTYNARRNNLETSWKKLFGFNHGILYADAFYEHVERDGQDVVLEFKPQGLGEEGMLVACLWSDTEWDGERLLSFAAITDEPPPEVAAAGHDRCVVPIKPEHVDAWLNPDPNNLAALQEILEDRWRPYYEHRIAA